MKKKNTCIVYMDGGICSQICQYIMGYQFMELGYQVRFDLSWYLLDGHDLNGKKNRKFDLLKLCPRLPFKKANIIQSSIYKKKYSFDSDKLDLVTQSTWGRVYLGGYYKLDKEQYQKIPRIIHMEPDMDRTNTKCAIEIENDENSVGVHVRRDDMSKEGYYWDVLTPQYYVNAIRKFPDANFYFFSDDINWVRENILKEFSGFHYKLMEHNGDNKGYLDLALLAKCKNFICSSGSLGKIAALLCENQKKKIVIPYSKNSIWLDVFPRESLLPIKLSKELCRNSDIYEKDN